MITGYQQDRWSLGASRGVYSSVWFNGAWVQVAVPATSACTGNPLYLRATDPWVTIRTRRCRLLHDVGHRHRQLVGHPRQPIHRRWPELGDPRRR